MIEYKVVELAVVTDESIEEVLNERTAERSEEHTSELQSLS